MIFNRKKAISALVGNKIYIKEFEDQLEPINTGWVILWKGKLVKPINGKSHYYESESSAMEAIDRNCTFGYQVYRDVFKAIYGQEITSEHVFRDTIYLKQFRKDLTHISNFVDGKLVSYTMRDRETLTQEEKIIKNDCDKEESAFISFCRNVIKTVFIKEWINKGLLEIKKI